MKNKFAEKLKSLREEQRLFQRDLAKNMGLTQPAIAKYESGDREPDLDTLIAFAKYFKVSTDFLLGLED